MELLFRALILTLGIYYSQSANLRNASDTYSATVPYKIVKDTFSENTTEKNKIDSTLKENVSKCELSLEVAEVGEGIFTLVTGDANIVKLDLVIKGYTGAFESKVPGDLYNPFEWIVTTGETGKALLMLRDYFVSLSLQTMRKTVDSVSVSLHQNPPNCLAELDIEEAEEYLRQRIFDNFGFKKTTLSVVKNIEVCSRHVVKDGSGGELRYKCCKIGDDRQIDCEYVKSSIWLKILFVSIVLMQIGLIMYIPVLLPESIYTDRKSFKEYSYYTEPDQCLSLVVKTVNDKDLITSDFKLTSLHSTARLERFKERLKTLSPNTVYTLDIDSVSVSVRASKVLAEGTSPAGLFDFIKRFFCQCRMRLEIKSVAGCCNQDMCTSVPGKKVVLWHECLQKVMKVFTIVLLFIPWIFRVMFYYGTEEENLAVQRAAFNARDLSVPYTGNMVSHFSPTHPVFLFVYIFLPLAMIAVSILPSSAKASWKWTIWKCFSNMKKARKGFACGVFTSYTLWPLTRFGVIGCVFLPLWFIFLPLFLLMLVLEVVPMVNLTFRYFVNFLYFTYRTCCRFPETDDPGKARLWFRQRLDAIVNIHPDEGGHRGTQLILSLALAATLIAMWAVILLAGECLSFYVECAVYMLIGFILDPGRAMKLLSVVMLITVYGHQSFTGVYKTYSSFCKSVHKELQEVLEEKLKDVALLPEEEQENTAFRIPPDVKKGCREKLKLVSGSEGQMKWNAKRLVLFLDKEDVPYIPKKLLFELANMKHFYCPGKVHLLYLWALYDFAKILVFLLFVFVVIFAFGQTNNVSSGRQSIAALGSGFLPLLLKKFFESAEISKSNLRWIGMFKEKLQEFSDRWHPVDIFVKKVYLGVHLEDDKDNISDDVFKDASDNVEPDQDTANDQEKEKIDSEKVLNENHVAMTSLLPPNMDVVNEYSPLMNGSLRRLSMTPVDVHGSETLLEGSYNIPNEDSDVDLIVLFGTDGWGDETIDFYINNMKETKKTTDDLIETPFEDNTEGDNLSEGGGYIV